ncbi:Bug family tripartite tricarboxylate transporter substrate binding protein [Roseomonas chloroacetimidivorans]|uniref:Bug family tripartite tricarboxylate transporter substrate binding protein n=1 Tax=Roseomonas chloroacetimidivorans TaxID=1766656 RepID=UPI003C73CA38
MRDDRGALRGPIGRRLLLGAATAALAGPALAAYPEKPLRMIIPYVPGGTTDLLGRLVADRLGRELGQNVVVENRSGAGGIVGTEAAARSAPDGYTLLLGNLGPIALNPSLYARLPYDPEKDFAALGRLADFPMILVVPAQLGVNSLAELLALARRPGSTVNFGSVGNGSVSHLAGEMLNRAAGLSMPHIPYRGGAQAYVDVLGGQVQVFFSTGIEAMPHIRAGRVKALAITSPARSPIAPELPTMRELGFPDFDIVAWFGLLAPAGIPPEIIGQIAAGLRTVMSAEEVRKSVLDIAAEPVTDTPAEFSALIRAEIRRWRPIIRAADVRIE